MNDIVMIQKVPADAHTFKRSLHYPHRFYFYNSDWSRDFFDAPHSGWDILCKGNTPGADIYLRDKKLPDIPKQMMLVLIKK